MQFLGMLGAWKDRENIIKRDSMVELPLPKGCEGCISDYETKLNHDIIAARNHKDTITKLYNSLCEKDNPVQCQKTLIALEISIKKLSALEKELIDYVRKIYG